MSHWELLRIEATKDKKKIKKAYAKAIKNIDPENEVKKFQQVREAYEHCCDYADYHQQSTFIKQSSQDEALFFEKLSGDNTDCNSEDGDENRGITTALSDFDSDQSISNSRLNELEVQSPARSADLFIAGLQDLQLRDANFVSDQWLILLQSEELDFLEVSKLLRIQVFEFFLEQLAVIYAKEYPDFEQIERNNLNKLIPDRLVEVVSAFAKFFDWDNHELELSRYFGHHQMELIQNLYQTNEPQNISLPHEKSSTGRYIFFWLVAVFVLFKMFSLNDDRINKNSAKQHTNFEQQRRKDQQAEKQRNTCLWLSNINNNSLANRCEKELRFEHKRQRMVLAYYWIMQYQKAKEEGEVDDTSYGFLNRGIKLLEGAAYLDYIPAINLLAAIYYGKYFAKQDQKRSLNYLEQSQQLGNRKALLLLAIIKYQNSKNSRNLWHKQNLQQSRELFEQVDYRSNLSAKQKYVLATAYLLQLKYAYPDGVLTVPEIVHQLYETAALDVTAPYLNLVAWFYSVTQSAYKDRELGLILAKQFSEPHLDKNAWRYIDTLAAAWAVNDDFYQAVKSMDKAIKITQNEIRQAQKDKGEEHQNRVKELTTRLISLQDTRKTYAKREILKHDFSINNLETIFSYYLAELYITSAKEIDR